VPSLSGASGKIEFSCGKKWLLWNDLGNFVEGRTCIKLNTILKNAFSFPGNKLLQRCSVSCVCTTVVCITPLKLELHGITVGL